MLFEPKHRYHVTFKNGNDKWETVPFTVKGLLESLLSFLNLIDASECYVEDFTRSERIFFAVKRGNNFIIKFPSALEDHSLTESEIYLCMRS